MSKFLLELEENIEHYKYVLSSSTMHPEEKHIAKIRLEECELFKESFIKLNLDQLEVKAARWDMLQWALSKQIPFVDLVSRHIGKETDCISLFNEDVEYLEILYKGREQYEKQD